GLGARVTELSEAHAHTGFETHVFFIGDPSFPGHESLAGGKLHLHRWCQWISEHHPGGVYDGEPGKLADWEQSLVPWLESELIATQIEADVPVVVLAEEWQTANTMTQLAEMIRRRGWQGNVHLFWNANHVFGFEHIDWPSLRRAATITTVSRFMRQALAQHGVQEVRVVPNGIAEAWFWPLNAAESRQMGRLLRNRLSLVKVARWDPDKGWAQAVSAVAELKKRGMQPLFLARGGHEPYRRTVMARIRTHGLDVGTARWTGNRPSELVEAMAPALKHDVVLLDGFLSLEQRRVLFHAADFVLANSSMEPFGLVGLETMAVGGVAFVGSTGEDYAHPGHDALSVETSDPREIVEKVMGLNRMPGDGRLLRQRARRSARHYSWPAVLKGRLLPLTHPRVPEPPSDGRAA
ncbi:MAG TPA: glycosyltransferase family 4 protein, partial [Chloroflexota bacterium]